MPSHYGVAVIPDAHKDAINVIIALMQSENPALSENVSQPANASGDLNDPATHWFGGRPYTPEMLAIYQDLANNIPDAAWPVASVNGSVTLQQAQDAAAALVLHVTTQETYSSQQAQQTLDAVLGSLSIQRAEEDE